MKKLTQIFASGIVIVACQAPMHDNLTFKSAAGLDTIPPANITTLTAVAGACPTNTPTNCPVTLNWIAVGNDNNVGTASSYEIRYLTGASCPVNATNFTTGALVANSPTPQIAGSAEIATVTGLVDRTLHCFAIKVADQSGNVSGISNVVNATTPDGTPPANVTTLAAGTITATSIVLNWTAVGNDGNVGTAASYELRYLSGGACPVSAGNFSTGTLVSGMPTPSASGTGETKTVTGLSGLTTYCFALKVSDAVPNTSGISNVVTATTLQGTTSTRVYGQAGSFATGGSNNGGLSADSLFTPRGIAVDATGVYIADYSNSRVLYYAGSATTATRVYGQAGSFATNAASTPANRSADNLNAPYDVAVDSTGVYIADNGNNRVLYYAGTSTTATRVYGQAGSFTTGLTNACSSTFCTANTLMAPTGIAVDATGLYVADNSNNRVLYYAGTSTTATRVYGQAGSFTAGSANNGGVSANSLSSPTRVAVDGTGVYIADSSNNRVLYYAGTATTATRVYGQGGSFTCTNLNTTGVCTGSGISANGLYNPTGVAVDATGVYIVDDMNHRVLYYAGTSTTATRVYGQLGSFTTMNFNNPSRSADSLYWPDSVTVNASRVYISDTNNQRVLFY